MIIEKGFLEEYLRNIEKFKCEDSTRGVKRQETQEEEVRAENLMVS